MQDMTTSLEAGCVRGTVYMEHAHGRKQREPAYFDDVALVDALPAPVQPRVRWGPSFNLTNERG